jgi:hypothetical protein
VPFYHAEALFAEVGALVKSSGYLSAQPQPSLGAYKSSRIQEDAAPADHASGEWGWRRVQFWWASIAIVGRRRHGR